MGRHNWYKYRPVSAAKLEIRIIILRPSLDTYAPIFCLLEHIQLEKNTPRYHALSYVWSDPPGTATIYLPGNTKHATQPFEVTTNLESALRHLRHQTIAIPLWVDAICIDQNSKKEKAEQVPLMGMKYSNAYRGFLWMGPQYSNYDLAIDILGRSYSLHPEKAYKEMKAVLDALDPPAWFHVLNFFNNLVWKRIWIVQELVLAKEIIVKCGKMDISWPTVQIIASCVLTTPAYDAFISDGGREGLRQAKAIADVSLRSADFLEIWCQFGWLTNLLVKPDYDLHLRDLYSKVTQTYILQQESLKILDYGYDSRFPSTADNLPSWVPDFGKGSNEYLPSFHLDEYSKPPNLPLLPWTSMNSSLVQQSLPLQLEVLGITLDVITYVSQETRGRDLEDVDYYFKTIRDDIEERNPPDAKYFNGESLVDVYVKTLCCGHIRPNKEEYKNFVPVHGPEEYPRDNRPQPRVVQKKIGSRWNFFSSFFGSKRFKDPGPSAEDNVWDEKSSPLKQHIFETTRGHAYAATEDGYMALVPDGAEAGDILCALNGGRTPYVLRGQHEMGKGVKGKASSQEADPNLWSCIGAAYMHGFMGGLPLRMRERKVKQEMKYVLI